MCEEFCLDQSSLASELQMHPCCLVFLWLLLSNVSEKHRSKILRKCSVTALVLVIEKTVNQNKDKDNDILKKKQEYGSVIALKIKQLKREMNGCLPFTRGCLVNAMKCSLI